MPPTAIQPDVPRPDRVPDSDRPPLFHGLGEWVDAHPRIALAVFFAIFICVHLGYSLRIPLWHDELFTYYIAQAPSIRALLHLTRTVDLNPPLSYLITRATFDLLGAGTLQTRLPEMVGYGLAFVALFEFVRRRAGTSAGLLVATILLCSKATEPAIDGRPYGLMFGFGALALLAWQSSTIAQDQFRSSRRTDFFLGLSAAALLLTHVFGLFLWGAIVAAETVNILQKRRLVPSRILALTLPLIVTWTYIPLFRLHAAGAYPPAFQAHLAVIPAFYFDRTSREVIAVIITVLLLAIIGGRRYLHMARRSAFTPAELTAAVAIALIPVVLIARLASDHGAFFYRYGDISVIGLALLITALLCRVTGNRSTPAVLAAIVFLMAGSRWQHAVTFAAQGHIFRHGEPPLIPYHPEALAGTDLPIVVNSGIVFIEMNYHESPAMLARTYYLTDGPVAVRYTHADIFQRIPAEIEGFHLSGRSQPYTAFLQQHPRFYLLASDHDYPEDWLLRKLHDDGAHLRLVGNVPNSYRDHNLYEVTLPATR
jgi:hypothetical protein